MKNLTLLPSNNIFSALESNNNSTLNTGQIATLTNNLKFAQQINTPAPEPLPTFTGRIQGTKFFDDNRNGRPDPGFDRPQPDVTIFLDQNNNGQRDRGESQTQTDSLGGYSFPNLLPGTYTVQEIVPAGFERLTPVRAVTVVANQTINFDIVNGFRFVPIPPTVTGRIQGTKFTNDVNRNGIFDAGDDLPQPGVTIFLDRNNNGQLDIEDLQTQTDSLGSYSFPNLLPGTYTVQEIVPAGFERLTPVQAVAVVANQTTNFDIVNRLNIPPTPPIGIPGILQFSNPSYSVNEDGTTIMEVMVTRTEGSLGAVDVTVLASDGTANAGTDYDATPITVSFIDGDTTPKPIRIPIINDSLFEPNENINLSLVNPTNGASLGVQSAANLIINRSDSGVPLPVGDLRNLQPVARDPIIRESGFDLSANALAIISAQQGGSGNFIDPLINPGQVARGITYDEGQSIIINVANGFNQKFSFRYASPFADHQVTIYDGVNGRGNVLASVQLPRTTDSNLTPGTYILESNPSSNLLFQGLGQSVIIGNQPNKLVLGDITFG